MTTYRIRGWVWEAAPANVPNENETIAFAQLPQQVFAPIRDASVEVWDKDERYDDRLGRSRTDSYGVFEIQFTEDGFQQEPREQERFPDLFFKAFRGRQELFSTDGEVCVSVGTGTFQKRIGVQWNWLLWDPTGEPQGPVTPIISFGVKQNPVEDEEEPCQQFQYVIQIFEAWIIPAIPDRDRELVDLPEEDFKGRVVDVLPSLDQVERSGISSLSTSSSEGGSLQQIVDHALGTVLCRPAKNDPKAFLASLTKSFVPKEVNGRKDYVWTPCTYNTVQTELGGTVSGAQASLYHRAKAALNEMLPLLDRLYPLKASADPQNLDASRSIVRTEIVELVNELGTQGGPRVQRVDSLFQLLIGDVEAGDPYEVVGGQLREMADIFGLTRSYVNTVDEEQNYGNYLIIRDYLVSLRGSWRTYIENSGSGAFVGSQLILLSQALSVVAESVHEVYRIMDLFFLGPAERQSVWIDFTQAQVKDKQGNLLFPKGQFPLPDKTLYKDGAQLKPAMTIESLLSWVARFATQEGPMLARSGGKIGIAKSLAETSDRLMILVQAASFVPVQNTAYQRAGVVRSLKDLAFQIYQVKRLAKELLPPITSSRSLDSDDIKDFRMLPASLRTPFAGGGRPI